MPSSIAKYVAGLSEANAFALAQVTGLDFLVGTGKALQTRKSLVQNLVKVQQLVEKNKELPKEDPTKNLVLVPISLVHFDEPGSLFDAGKNAKPGKKTKLKVTKKRKKRESDAAPTRDKKRSKVVSETWDLSARLHLDQIREQFEQEFVSYRQKLECKPGKGTLVDKRKHVGNVKRDFYNWFAQHIPMFMDNYLYPHRELRKDFELQSCAIPNVYPVFQKEDLDSLVSVLTEYSELTDTMRISKTMGLSLSRQKKLRNQILHLSILFNSYLDFLHALKSDPSGAEFQRVKSQVIHTRLYDSSHDKLGKSARESVEKTLHQYRFRES
jgi:hypothetical protein